MELLKIKDIMRIYGVGRPTAMAWAIESGAAVPRRKGQMIRVNRAALENYLTKRKG